MTFRTPLEPAVEVAIIVLITMHTRRVLLAVPSVLQVSHTSLRKLTMCHPTDFLLTDKDIPQTRITRRVSSINNKPHQSSLIHRRNCVFFSIHNFHSCFSVCLILCFPLIDLISMDMEVKIRLGYCLGILFQRPLASVA